MKFKKLISKKGFKKAVTAALTLTMLFSSVVSVFAAGEGIPDPAIDRSITIHKYRMDDMGNIIGGAVLVSICYRAIYLRQES